MPNCLTTTEPNWVLLEVNFGGHFECHYLVGSNGVTTCFPLFSASTYIEELICKLSRFYPEVYIEFETNKKVKIESIWGPC